jgi:opacity protein-like surface antigen
MKRNASEIYQNIRRTLVIMLTLLVGVTAVAQEYKYEIGGMVGMAMYMGDANQISLLRGFKPAAGVVFRKNTNFRWAVKTNLMMGRIAGDTGNTKNVFPNDTGTTFSRNFFDLGGQMEFNFLPYSDKFAYLNTSRISPYLLAGLGITVAPGKNQTFLGLNIPLGIGVKYKIKNRINLGLEYSVHRLFGDDFDAPDSKGFNLDNPYGIKSGSFKNKDWYNTLLFSVTWDFGPNDRKCTNE